MKGSFKLKHYLIFGLLLYIGFFLISCASPMVNLQTARIKKKWHAAGIYQMRHIERYKYKAALMLLTGCEFRLSKWSQIIIEGGMAPHYFRNDNLYILGFGLNID